MEATVEWLVGCLRIADEGDVETYHLSATILRKGDSIWIMGVSTIRGKPQELKTAMQKWCAANGVKHVHWERRKGKRRTVKYSLTSATYDQD